MLLFIYMKIKTVAQKKLEEALEKRDGKNKKLKPKSKQPKKFNTGEVRWLDKCLDGIGRKGQG